MSDCSCVYASEADESITCYARYERKARKQHKCLECGEDILPGAAYVEETGRLFDRFVRFHICAVCVNIRDVLFCGHWCYESLMEDLYNHLMEGPLSEECLAKLSPGARDRVLSMIQKMIDEDGE